MTLGWTLFKLVNHRFFRLTLITLCVLCIYSYFMQIRDEKRMLTLDDAIPALIDHHHIAKTQRISPNPIASQLQPIKSMATNQKLRIRIAIPSSCKQRELNLRRMQRMSWIQYLDHSNPLWHDMHSQCTFSYHYYIGKCKDSEGESSANLRVENKKYGDLIRLNVSEQWDNLQRKTLKIIFNEHVVGGDGFDLLLKTDTDSYVNAPNLCQFMVDLMNSNSWNGRRDALYLGVLRDSTEIRTGDDHKYTNPEWIRRVRARTYTPFMAGFGYFLSAKTVEIIYKSLNGMHRNVAFNRLEDTFLGHYLTSWNVKFVNISAVIDPYGNPNTESLNTHILDHMYNTDEWGVLMVDKYKIHCRLHQLYLNAKVRRSSLV